MDLVHSTGFWVVIILGPLGTVLGIFARLSQKEPPPVLPPGVAPGTTRPRAEKGDPPASDNP
ncbi:hypothetical protein [Paludibacterium paludis]|uniref:Uncharacterized protein n=1 Tax=Paludibacterium paludis TaxID=1225769 RepID=A0A918UB93_9NEIS|nr:hypothetical protein [Paludibacterium paludis]GGY21565.1 hypothetical protein GCM10011289_26480 [Paludibacterium paludis]